MEDMEPDPARGGDPSGQPDPDGRDAVSDAVAGILSRNGGTLPDEESGVAFATYQRVFAEKRHELARWKISTVPVVVGLTSGAITLLTAVVATLEKATIWWLLLGLGAATLLGIVALIATGAALRSAESLDGLRKHAHGVAAEAVVAFRLARPAPAPSSPRFTLNIR